MSVQIEFIGGNCPVQAECTICGKPFYFRARGSRWTMGIGDDPVSIPHRVEIGSDGKPVHVYDEWFVDCTWGKWPDAGWMPEDEAKRLIEWCAGEYARNAASRSLEAPPAPVLSSAAVSDRANEERLPEPPQWPRDGSP
jgi:hypothetical protein